MTVVIVLYCILQSAATFFLSFQFLAQSFVKHCFFASLAIAAYLAAHLITPGFANQETLKLGANPSELTSSVTTMDGKGVSEGGYCRHCKEEKLMRMKHCHDCGKCVATYDHHCLWLSNCVGEKNRPFFLLCLLTNLLEIMYAFAAMVGGMVQNGEWFPYQIAFLSFLGVVGSGVGLLLALHCYLMAVNLTTWECLRWQSIPYLTGLNRRQGSPFSRGFIGNIVDYWTLAFQKSFRQWKLNSSALQQLSSHTLHDKEEG